jgi:hypothetical protein
MTLFDQSGSGLNSVYERLRDAEDARDAEPSLSPFFRRCRPFDRFATRVIAREPQLPRWCAH